MKQSKGMTNNEEDVKLHEEIHRAQFKKSFSSTWKIGNWEHPQYEKGPKFDRIVNVRVQNQPKQGLSVFFVDKSNGDIYKPARIQWKYVWVISEPKTYVRSDVHGGWLYRR